MSKLQQALENGTFAVTAEVAPPKGADFTEVMENAQYLKGRVYGVNVTDMQSACVKATSLGLCIQLKQAGIEPVIQMTGRDRSRIAIMGEMFSAAAFGIDTMLAITGDHTMVGDCKAAKPVFDLDSCGILKMLTEMEETGKDCGGNDIEGVVPHFYKGACVTPVYEPLELQIIKLKKKVDCGAKYVQTQGIFEIDSLKRFMDAVDKANIDVKVLAGIIPLKAAGMAKFMNNNVPGIAVPDEQIERLAKAAVEGKEQGVKGLPMQAGIDMAAQLIAQIRDEKLCDGVHIMTVGAEKNVPVILDKAGIASLE
jgi:5,10-methylenetetrahydrofolate reductase